MSKQDLFNKSAQHVLKQGQGSHNEYGDCLYRNGDKQCAAGPFILDYRDWMEGRSWPGVIKEASERDELDKLDHAAVAAQGFVAQLQSAHDQAVRESKHYSDLEDESGYEFNNDEFMAEYKANMRRLAQNHGLDASVLDATS